jgi:ketosteroid isomerase-like protein
MSTTITSTFDAGALRTAIENRDAAAIADLYTDDCVVEIADAQNPPSAPRRIEGKAALSAVLEDVYGRDMSHEVGPIAVGADAVGYTIHCSYRDGKKVLCAGVAQLRDGRIARETGVQAWDA